MILAKSCLKLVVGGHIKLLIFRSFVSTLAGYGQSVDRPQLVCGLTIELHPHRI